MFHEKVVILPKSMSPSKRIAEAKKQIIEWLESLRKPLNKNNLLRFRRWEERGKEYMLHYEIVEREDHPNKDKFDSGEQAVEEKTSDTASPLEKSSEISL